MSEQMPKARILLLVEDNPADADLVTELLDRAGGDVYEIRHAARLSDAVTSLESGAVDVILLDLRLPDASGVDAVKAVRQVADGTPIVVLTGTDDETLALSCIHAGAQDYLCKNEIRPTMLRRAIGYAISRLRELQIRELQTTLEHYRSLASTTSSVAATAEEHGDAILLRDRKPQLYADMIRDYAGLLNNYLDHLVEDAAKPRSEMTVIVNELGSHFAGPRDLLDMHIAALDDQVSSQSEERSRAIAIEGRLLAVEMMGLLVDFYRSGLRRRLNQGAAT